MLDAIQGVLFYAFIPVVAMIIGGVVAAFRPPNPTVQSYLQHFAAGVVFAAAAGEVLPEIMHERSTVALIIALGLGLPQCLASNS